MSRLLKENLLDEGEIKSEDRVSAMFGPGIFIGYHLINDKIMLCFKNFGGIGLIDLQEAKECIERLQKTYSILSQEDISEINLLADKRHEQRHEQQSQEKHFEKKIKGYVYFLKSGKHIKIGRCENLSNRITQIKLQLPNPALLIHAIKTNDCIQCEKDFHKQYASKKSNGEWFLLSEADIKEIKKIEQRDY